MSKLSRPDDSHTMRRAIKQLVEAKHFVSRPSDHQLKVRDLNFWPDKGTITRDGQRGRLPQRGLDAFLALLRPAQARPADAAASQPTGDAAGFFVVIPDDEDA